MFKIEFMILYLAEIIAAALFFLVVYLISWLFVSVIYLIRKIIGKVVRKWEN